jgi:HAD superfamily hydrolase (TIGR01509 family)
MKIEAIIFDFDGLLMDTESCSLASWQHAWRQHGLELDIATFWANHGGDVSEERYALLAAAVGPAFDRDACHSRRLAFRDELHATLGYRPGIEAWLERATELGLRMAIASSSHRPWVTMHLERVGDLPRFELLACGDEVAGHKPDPAVYRLALDRLGVSPERAIAVEDTPHGVLAAKAAGMRCVAIPNLYPFPDSFTHADLVVENATAMPLDAVLDSLSRTDRATPRVVRG